MDDLRMVAQHSPVARSFLAAWEAGSYPSLESALIGLACYLASQNEELQRHVMKATQFGPIAVSESLKLQTSHTPTAEAREQLEAALADTKRWWDVFGGSAPTVECPVPVVVEGSPRE
jgi:hypothetical protein